MGRKAGRHNQQHTRFQAEPSRGRRVLSIVVNPEDQEVNSNAAGLQSSRSTALNFSQVQCGGIAVTQQGSAAVTAGGAAAENSSTASREQQYRSSSS